MSTPTKQDARGRDRTPGPVESAYDRWVRGTSWAIGLALALALVSWFIEATNVEPLPEARVLALLALATALVMLPARVVVGALRDAAAASGS